MATLNLFHSLREGDMKDQEKLFMFKHHHKTNYIGALRETEHDITALEGFVYSQK